MMGEKMKDVKNKMPIQQYISAASYVFQLGSALDCKLLEDTAVLYSG